MSLMLCLALVGAAPFHTAETIPAGRTMAHAAGGFSLLRVGLPAVEVAPVLTGDLEIAWGFERADLRVRYSTFLGLVHRLGPELRVRIARVDALSVAARLHPSVQLVGALEDGVDVGGDISTLGSLLVTLRTGEVAWSLDGGATVQWLLFEDIDGRSFVDDEPYLAFVNVGLGVEWADGPTTSYSVRIELAAPTGPDDPFTIAGFVPRLLVGGSFSL